MGVTKTSLYDARDLEVSAMAKALAHPARVAIIRCLLQSDSCMTGDLSSQIGLAQPTISQHLKELKSVGIIQGTISGTAVNYCINPDIWVTISQAFAAFFDEFSSNKNCC